MSGEASVTPMMRPVSCWGKKPLGTTMNRYTLRAQVSPAILPTYYFGHAEVSDLAAAVRAANPAWPDRQLHDAMLAHGTAPVRHLRTLLGVPPAPRS